MLQDFYSVFDHFVDNKYYRVNLSSYIGAREERTKFSIIKAFSCMSWGFLDHRHFNKCSSIINPFHSKYLSIPPENIRKLLVF